MSASRPRPCERDGKPLGADVALHSAGRLEDADLGREEAPRVFGVRRGLQIRAGTGGSEGQLAGGDVLGDGRWRQQHFAQPRKKTNERGIASAGRRSGAARCRC